MKLMILVSGLILVFEICPSPSSKTPPPVMQDTVSFADDIQPILMQRCSPCHFPGGKMYHRMPFDKDTTILSHQEGILKRIKDEKENSLFRRFLEKNGKEVN